MSLPINTSETLTISTGANPELTSRAFLRTETAKVQVTVGGATTNTDVFIEGRLTPDVGFGRITAEIAVTNGFNQIWTIDTDDLYEVQVRVVNRDGVNAGTATAIVRSD